MSGLDSSRRQSATRRFSPPDSVVTAASPGGQRNASIAMSTVRSSSHALAASIRSCSAACLSSSACISSSVIGSANFALISSNRVSRSRIGCSASSTLPRTSLVGVEQRLLRQVADPHAVRRLRFAEKILVDAGHDAQQGRLAGAVGADDADLGAGIEREIDPLEDLALGRDDLAQVPHREDVFAGHGAKMLGVRGGWGVGGGGGGGRGRGMRSRELFSPSARHLGTDEPHQCTAHAVSILQQFSSRVG